VRSVAALAEARGRPVVAEDVLLEDLGLRVDRRLRRERHVMLAAMGENAFLVALERHLERERGADRRPAAEGRAVAREDPELPPDVQGLERCAVRLEWLTIAYLVTRSSSWTSRWPVAGDQGGVGKGHPEPPAADRVPPGGALPRAPGESASPGACAARRASPTWRPRSRCCCSGVTCSSARS